MKSVPKRRKGASTSGAEVPSDGKLYREKIMGL